MRLGMICTGINKHLQWWYENTKLGVLLVNPDKSQAGGNYTELKGFKGDRVTSGLQNSVIPHIFEVIHLDDSVSFPQSRSTSYSEKKLAISYSRRDMAHACSIMKLWNRKSYLLWLASGIINSFMDWKLI